MGKYYDGTKLLSMKDIHGQEPDIYICTSNRTAGKTTYWGRFVMNRYFRKGEKFALLYRYQYELDDCADKFYKDIGSLFFPGTTLESVRMANGIFHKLVLDEEQEIGYAISLNSADTLKKYSHLFSDVSWILFDEFQSETNHYCANEISKFISIHTSIARGQGEMVKRVPVIMISNPVSIINPYYVAMGISSRLRKNTHFLRGEGYVLEQGFNEAAADAQAQSGFNRAFKNEVYTQYAAEGVYLNDNEAFIAQPIGTGRYICTIKYNGQTYGIREYAEQGILYVNDKADNTYRLKITTTTADHDVNYIMLKRHSQFIGVLREYFEKGCFRFKDLKSKEALLSTLSYI